MDPEAVGELIRKGIPGAQVEVSDMTGGGDHFIISVTSPVFEGKTLIVQHRIVQGALEEALSDGRIHAVQIKTQVSGRSRGSASQGDGLNIIH